MSDIPLSPEAVAYKLMDVISAAEGKSIAGGLMERKYDRQYLLDLYAECLTATKGQRYISENADTEAPVRQFGGF